MLTAHSGCLNTAANSLAYLEAALAHPVDFVELDTRFDGTLVLSHDAGPRPGRLALGDIWNRVAEAGVGVNFDVKEEAVLAPLAEFVARAGQGVRAVVTGCDAAWALQWSQRNTGVPVLLNVLVGPAPGQKLWEEHLVLEALRAGAAGLNADHRVLTPLLVACAHEAGLSVDVWTVNDAASMERWAALGVQGLTTDRPDLAHPILTRF